MDYTHYSIDDFITDEKFIRWVKNPDNKISSFWELWIEAHPEKKQEIENARQIVLMMDFRIEKIDANRLTSLKEKIHQRTGTKNYHKRNVEKATDSFENKGRVLPVNWYRVAASVAALLVLGFIILFYLNKPQNSYYTTGYGEAKSLILPDSSKVILNANSKLSYNPDWENQSSRMVTLDGEAFFQVRPEGADSSNAKKFIVRTNDLDVEVVGTRFNVNNRRNRTQVVLIKGRVKLNQEEGGALQELVMTPGELVEFTSKDKKFTKKKVNPEVYTSWRENRLVFDNTPLKEIAFMIEENYGYRVAIEDKNLADRKLTARLPTKDLQVLLKTIETTFKMEIKRNENTLKFQNQ